MDMVEQAGIDVSKWKTRADGSAVKTPRANPHFCYEWAFGGGSEPTLLCVWHENLSVSGAELVCIDNYQALAQRLEDVASQRLQSSEVRTRAESQAKRAWAFDRKLQSAFRARREVRVVLLKGKQRDAEIPGASASEVDFRLLDSEPWHVASYENSGAFQLVRGRLKVQNIDSKPHLSLQLGIIGDERLIEALMEVDSQLPGNLREALVAHAKSRSATLSVNELIEAGRFDQLESVISAYRKLGTTIASFADMAVAGDPLGVLCSYVDGGVVGSTSLTLHPGLVGGLQKLGIVKNEVVQEQRSDSLLKEVVESPELAGELPTSRLALAEARLGQGAYRKKMLRLWGGACSLTGCSVEQVLVASHALPWSQSTSHQRLDHYNGLLLTGTLDRLFDRGLIAISKHGGLLISPALSLEQRAMLHLHEGLKLRSLHERMIPYLALHREMHAFA
jgi:hypothetical protein